MTEYFTIELTQGKVARVDKEDFERLSAVRWQASRQKDGGHSATRAVRRNGKIETISMARKILNLGPDEMVVYTNRDSLDCRRSNMRVGDRAKLAHHCALSSRNTSGVKGVSWDKKNCLWAAQIRAYGKSYKRRLGTVSECVTWLNVMRIKLHGAFASDGLPVING